MASVVIIRRIHYIYHLLIRNLFIGSFSIEGKDIFA